MGLPSLGSRDRISTRPKRAWNSCVTQFDKGLALIGQVKATLANVCSHLTLTSRTSSPVRRSWILLPALVSHELPNMGKLFEFNRNGIGLAGCSKDGVVRLSGASNCTTWLCMRDTRSGALNSAPRGTRARICIDSGSGHR